MKKEDDYDDADLLLEPDVKKNGLLTRCAPKSSKSLLFCCGGFLAFLCIVASIVAPVVLLFVDEQSFDPAIQTCSTNATLLVHAATNTSSTSAIDLLTNITDVYGPRLTGSQNLENAIDWVIGEMKRQGLDNVHKEPVQVPAWKRGNETLLMREPFVKHMSILGLGGTVNTTDAGVEAVVLVVNSYDHLLSLAGVANGTIVLFDVPFTTYGQTVTYRYNAAKWAAEVGAVAALVRSVTPFSLYTPHTGLQGAYSNNASVARVPAAAVTVEDAGLLRRLTSSGHVVRLHLRIVGDDGYDASGNIRTSTSYNIVGQITGSLKPNEVIAMGGHIDSWDVGQGALDDIGGFVAAWEAVRLMKALNITPLRTVRVVGWVSEENGGAGADQYAKDHINETTVLAIESDEGINAPTGISFAGTDGAYNALVDISQLLTMLQTNAIQRSVGSPAADVGPLFDQGVPAAALNVAASANYFYYHHSNADTADKIVVADLQRSAATLAVYGYCVAQANAELPRVPPPLVTSSTTTTTTMTTTTK